MGAHRIVGDMANSRAKRDHPLTVRDLYPHLTDEQLKEADYNLNRYLEHALRMFERLRADPEAYARFKALTASRRDSTMKDTRSTSSS